MLPALRYWLMLALLFAGNSFAQTLLDQRISIQFENQTLEEALNSLAEIAECSFSYNPALLPLDQKITQNYRRTRFSAILDDLLGSLQLQYRPVGKYIIIEPAPEPTYRSAPPIAKNKKKEKPKVVEAEPEPEMVVEEEKAPILVEPIERSVPEPELEIQAPTPIDDVFFVKLLIDDEVLQEPTYRNQLKTRFAQVTLISPIGTNLLQSGKYNNIFSLNLLAGYAGGVQGVEVGGFLNVVRYDVKGVQVSGGGNVVGGRLYGTQVAGFSNINRGSITGVQVAGAANWADTLHYGLQVAGFTNILTGEGNGIQIAGFGNFAWRNVNGLQIGGFYNWAKNVKGWQFASTLNIGRNVTGGQLAGLFNVARTVKGVQIAPFNYCDSIQGVPIGIFSYVKQGYHRVVLSSSETVPMQFSYKTGATRLFNIFTMGLGASNRSGFASLGYGAGTQFPILDRHRLQLELTSSQVFDSRMEVVELNLLNELHFGWNGPLGRKYRWQAGPSAYLHTSNWQDQETLEYFSDLAPYVQREWTGDFGTRYQFWIGGKLSFGF
ncbi:MAG: STN domain-containing protein [Bacteroidota bacterium]